MKKFFSDIFFYAVKWILYIYAVIFQGLRLQKNGYKIPKEPVLFLSNHQSNWDGIYLNLFSYRKNIRCLINEEAFKNKSLRFVIGDVLQMIKRGNSKSDVSAIKNLIKAKKEGKDIGIYPEGDIGYLGTNLDCDIAISKLVKKLDMTVVICRINGAHIRAPRWSFKPNHSKMIYQIVDVIDKDDLKSMNLDVLHQRIMNGISYDEHKFQEEAQITIHSQKRAEHLELVLYMCPECGKIETMKSKGSMFRCTHCGYEVEFGKKYTFTSGKYLTTLEWDKFQKKELEKRLINYSSKDIILESDNMNYYHVKYGQFFGKSQNKCKIVLYKNQLEVIIGNDKLNLSLDELKCSYKYKATLQIEIGDDKYRFDTKDKIWSSYLWVSTINILKMQQS